MVDKLNVEEDSLIILFKKIKLEQLLLPCKKDMYEEIYLSHHSPLLSLNYPRELHTLKNFTSPLLALNVAIHASRACTNISIL